MVQVALSLVPVISNQSIIFIENEITLSKKTFVNVHSADNIRDDYLIGKVLGSGKLYISYTYLIILLPYLIITVYLIKYLWL
jgi:hypothetical protein